VPKKEARMSMISGLLNGVVSSLTFTSPPLYRYPYRNALEAFRGDWKHIGSDILATQESLRDMHEESTDE